MSMLKKLRQVERLFARIAMVVSVVGVIGVAGAVEAGSGAVVSEASPLAVSTTPPRRVNIPRMADPVTEGQSAIFWFGQNQFVLPTNGQSYQTPTLNYVDVRMAYTASGLYWRANVIDYYMWYVAGATTSSVLTQTDAIALYLDTGHDRAATPQPDDYYFLVGQHGDVNGVDTPQYRRQARGTGAGWDTTWHPQTDWSDYSGWQWGSCNPGPNNNTCGYDFGYEAGGTIPWQTLGLSGPPADGALWGMGVLLYDQDNQPPAYPVQMESWPETFAGNNPGQWGEIHFGLPHYAPPPAIQRGVTTIRDLTPADTTVQDAWMGGGGSCSGGQNGGSTINHGQEADLFVGSENQPTNFPCYNKSYLRFDLSSLPPGKVIISATLTLHQWGSAGDPTAAKAEDHGHDSFVWLDSVPDPWSVSTITWNTAPLIQQNLSMTRVPTWPANTSIVWPGVPFSLDATQLVADAYAAGQPASMAIYDSAIDRNTSKYLTGSAVGQGNPSSTWNWDINGRPRLDIAWGDPVLQLTKQASNTAPRHGTPVTYTLGWPGAGASQWVTDTLPAELQPPASLQCSSGAAPVYNSGTGQITWSGSPGAGVPMTMTYVVTPTALGPLAVSNTAQLSVGGAVVGTSATIIIDGSQLWLPLLQR